VSSIFSYDTIAKFLKSVLAKRAEVDTRYSLRTMAKDLGISPAHLSQVMNSKKTLSPKSRLKLAESLGLNDSETRYFYLLVQFENAPSPSIKAGVKKQMDELGMQWAEQQAMDVDHFKVIAEWYHVPILEMTYLEGFDLSAASAAARLGLTEAVAEAAIERLTRLGLLSRGADGRLVKAEKNLVVRTDRRNEAFGNYLRQMMHLAEDAMDAHAVAERVIMSQTFCIDLAQLDEARQMTRDYLRTMAALHEKASSATNVYQLNVQFFNLTDGRKKAD